MKKKNRYVWIALSALTISSLAMAQTETMSKSAATGDGKAAVEAKASSYPLDHCIVSGEKLGEMGDPVVKVYDGREVKFCCNMCVKSFEKDQAKWMKKLDEAIITEQKGSYPVQTCVVSGEKLGGMGEPYDYIYQNRLIRFCCGGCVKTFEKDPGKYLSMLDAAKASETPKDEKSLMKDSHQPESTAH